MSHTRICRIAALLLCLLLLIPPMLMSCKKDEPAPEGGGESTGESAGGSGTPGEVSSEGLLFSPKADGTCEVSGYDPARIHADVLIPATYEGRPVTGIASEAFGSKSAVPAEETSDISLAAALPAAAGRSGLRFLAANDTDAAGSTASDGEATTGAGLRSVSFAEDSQVKNIRDYAFAGCTSLTAFTVPASVAEIGDYAFSGTGLTEITIPAALEKCGSGVFANCVNLTKATFSEGYRPTYIVSELFENCEKLAEITIPASVEQIRYRAFYGCTGLARVTYAEECQLDSIDVEAFAYCTGLPEITIPESVTKFGTSSPFIGCTNLTRVIWNAKKADRGYVPDGVAENKVRLFSGCPSLTQVLFGETVETIADNIFSNCVSLTDLTIPAGVTEIEAGAFAGCTGLAHITVDSANDTYRSAGNCVIEKRSGTLVLGCKNSEIPDDGSVTGIGESAFRDCTGLTEVTLPASVTTIGPYAFYGCTGLTEISIPVGVTNIVPESFMRCARLSTLTVDPANGTYRSAGNCVIEKRSGTLVLGCKGSVIPDDGSVTSIGIEAFLECIGLTEIVIPDGVTTIEMLAFSGCRNLVHVTIGADVTRIGREGATISSDPFQGCVKLIEVCNLSGLDIRTGEIPADVGCLGYYAKNVYTASSGERKTYTDANGYIFYADGDTCYLMGYTGDESALTLPDTGKGQNYEIYKSAFYQRTDLTSVTIGAGVTRIGYSAFFGCTRLADVTFSAAGLLQQIDSGAFGSCAALTQIAIPDGVTELGGFSDCTGLTEFTIPASVTLIGFEAFFGCTGLTEIAIPANVTLIDGFAFTQCTRLANVTFAAGSQLSSIGSRAFSNCTNLQEIVIPEGVTQIGECAFESCERLTDVSLPASVTDIDSSAFLTFASLAHFTVAEGNPRYGSSDGILYDFRDGIAIHVPRNLHGTIRIPEGITMLNNGGYEFGQCAGIVRIELPASMTYIDGHDLAGCASLVEITVAAGNPKYHSAGNCVIETESKTLVCGCKTSVIPNDGSVTSIEYSAFQNRKGLTEIAIPTSVKNIELFPFYGCQNLWRVYFEETEGWNVIGGSGEVLEEGLDLTDSVKNAALLSDRDYMLTVSWSYLARR